MKNLYRMIFIFLCLLLYLDWRERNTNQVEKYCNRMDDSNEREMTQNNAINLGKKQFNFTTNGKNPFINCPQCYQTFDCSNYPYQVDDKYATLCTTCLDKNSDYYKVLGKQPGRPRSCQKLY